MVNTVLCGIFGVIMSNAWSYHLVVVVVAVYVVVYGCVVAVVGMKISDSFCCISEDSW